MVANLEYLRQNDLALIPRAASSGRATVTDGEATETLATEIRKKNTTKLHTSLE